MDQLVQYNVSKDRYQRRAFPAYKDCLDPGYHINCMHTIHLNNEIRIGQCN